MGRSRKTNKGNRRNNEVDLATELDSTFGLELKDEGERDNPKENKEINSFLAESGENFFNRIRLSIKEKAEAEAKAKVKAEAKRRAWTKEAIKKGEFTEADYQDKYSGVRPAGLGRGASWRKRGEEETR